MLAKQLHRRFGAIPGHLLERIGWADEGELQRWVERFADSYELDEIFS